MSREDECEELARIIDGGRQLAWAQASDLPPKSEHENYLAAREVLYAGYRRAPAVLPTREEVTDALLDGLEPVHRPSMRAPVASAADTLVARGWLRVADQEETT